MTTQDTTIELYPLFKYGNEIIVLLVSPRDGSFIKAGVAAFNVPNMSKVPFPKWEEAGKSYTLHKVSGTLDYGDHSTVFNSNMQVVSELPGWSSQHLQEYKRIYFYLKEEIYFETAQKGNIKLIDDQCLKLHFVDGPFAGYSEILYITELLNSARKLSKYRKYKALLREAEATGVLVQPLINRDKDVISLAFERGRLLDGGSLPQDL